MSIPDVFSWYDGHKGSLLVRLLFSPLQLIALLIVEVFNIFDRLQELMRYGSAITDPTMMHGPRGFFACLLFRRHTYWNPEYLAQTNSVLRTCMHCRYERVEQLSEVPTFWGC